MSIEQSPLEQGPKSLLGNIFGAIFCVALAGGLVFATIVSQYEYGGERYAWDEPPSMWGFLQSEVHECIDEQSPKQCQAKALKLCSGWIPQMLYDEYDARECEQMVEKLIRPLEEEEREWLDSLAVTEPEYKDTSPSAENCHINVALNKVECGES